MILLLKFNSHFSARLREHLARPVDQGLDANTKKRLNLQVFIASLLCEHCDFDKLRVENAGMTPILNLCVYLLMFLIGSICLGIGFCLTGAPFDLCYVIDDLTFESELAY